VAKDKCFVITNGIETADFVPNLERRAMIRSQMGIADEFVWLFVGRHSAAKDIPNLLHAFAIAWTTAGRIQLWIAGDAPRSQSGRATDVGTGLPHEALKRVRWLGLRRDIPALLDAADGFVLASAWEGMPLAVGEAMAMGKPVVATDVGGVRELVGDAGVLVPGKNADALASAMLSIMELPDSQRSELGAKARERILRNFRMDAKADQWEPFYRAVVGHSASSPAVVP
jgi:glycosyltransferase involved in cell wall biosynthesis